MKSCLGFYFSEDRERVLLKKRPDGLFDGFRGVVRQTERERYAMIREFYHSTVIDTYLPDWTFFGTLDATGRRLADTSATPPQERTYVFYSFGDPWDALTTEEPLHVFDVHALTNFAVSEDAKRLINDILTEVQSRVRTAA